LQEIFPALVVLSQELIKDRFETLQIVNGLEGGDRLGVGFAELLRSETAKKLACFNQAALLVPLDKARLTALSQDSLIRRRFLHEL
jgi:hypothetical protein